MAFALADRWAGRHLIVMTSDAALNPPESYFYIQDGLIISCAVLYALCYYFYMLATIRDRYLAGSVEYLCGTMSYELYYALVMPSSLLEMSGFLVWFLMDATTATIIILYAYPPHERQRVATRTFVGFLVGIAFFHGLCLCFPDERDQVTAYWTGWLLQLPVGWVELYYLVTRGDTKGQSLEIWICRFFGCLTAIAVFMWRYWNVPENWEYVGSGTSIALVVITILAEVIYPYFYITTQQKMVAKAATSKKED